MNKKTERKTRSGYILILTILVISILLAIGLGINAINLKEVTLSSFMRDSEKALAAADRGMECALYWDRTPSDTNPVSGLNLQPINGSVFASTTDVTQFPSNYDQAYCNDGTADNRLQPIWTVTRTPGPPESATTIFSFSYSDGTCAEVSVTKTGSDSTSIVSDGYNTCTVDFSRRTQRELSVYTNI